MSDTVVAEAKNKQQAEQIDVIKFLSEKYSREGVNVIVRHVFDNRFRINIWGLRDKTYPIQEFGQTSMRDGPVIIESHFVAMVHVGQKLDVIDKGD